MKSDSLAERNELEQLENDIIIFQKHMCRADQKELEQLENHIMIFKKWSPAERKELLEQMLEPDNTQTETKKKESKKGSKAPLRSEEQQELDNLKDDITELKEKEETDSTQKGDNTGLKEKEKPGDSMQTETKKKDGARRTRRQNKKDTKI
eukprot:15496521-Heterocapsa_arctica.AAC.1